MTPDELDKDATCDRCGGPATVLAGDEPICENCWQLAGACCSGE
ncbi:MAG: hypothetical protein ABI162_19320 [Luteolibacter sp.]